MSELRGRPGSPGAARIALRTPGELTGAAAELHTLVTAGLRATSVVPLTDEAGRLLGPFAAMLLHPHLGTAVQAVGAALRTDPLLSDRVRELAVLTVAAGRDSEFEWLAHEPAARAVGLSTADLQALLDVDRPPDVTDEEELVVQLVRQLLADGTLDDEQYARAVATLGEPVLAALVWLVGYYSMLATGLAVFRPPLH